MAWHVYIIKCKDGLLYTGITNNLDRRVSAHNSGNGGRFTKYRAPVKLAYSEDCLTRSDALKREVGIKRLTRAAKLKLIKKNRR
jgi:putative endonuclease